MLRSRTMVKRVLLGALLAAVLQGGCVPTSEHPLSPKADPALLGSWRGKMKDGSPVIVHFLRAENGEVRSILVSEKEPADRPGAWAVFRLTTAEVAGTRYLSAWWELNDGKPAEGSDQGYHLMRYVLSPKGRLQLFAVNEKKLAAAVEAKKVAGTAKVPEVRLTDSSEALATFLKGERALELFSEPFATLHKL